ncbi:hypothetical protein RJ639_016517 [Escallonia herrerae]|uniref:Uncharacterized protein n=1 Tax=Escallonia herrerae TaxID=1293975 RepID=A0AA89AK05_9ASTE|nr:hypothetical protein RJ639_016517 [Escallonia herrerae]
MWIVGSGSLSSALFCQESCCQLWIIIIAKLVAPNGKVIDDSLPSRMPNLCSTPLPVWVWVWVWIRPCKLRFAANVHAAVMKHLTVLEALRRMESVILTHYKQAGFRAGKISLVEMEGGIDAEALLDYAEFRIFPGQNRYEACVCSGNKVETVASGRLEPLLLHSPEIKDLYAKGSDADFRIQPPNNLKGSKWFTKSTLLRIIRIILEVRKQKLNPRLSSYLTDSSTSNGMVLQQAEEDIVSSDASKNSLRNLVEVNQESLTDFPRDSKPFSKNDSSAGRVGKSERSNEISRPSNSDTPVKYGVSPAKVAQVERECSTESDESSSSGEEDQPSVERSRTLTRSATPRRSASPMRRIQIGRSGSRRATPITIKSLNFFPARERVVSHGDEAVNSSEGEGSEKPPRKSDNHVRRMSVQDAISLFENKQKDQPVENQKTRSLLNPSVGANRSVLRRWSSGMGESSAQCPPDTVSESSSPVALDNIAGGEASKSSQELKPDSDFVAGCQIPAETAEVDAKSDSSEKRVCNPIGIPVNNLVTQREEVGEKITASAEWSRQKEAELNQLLMKMMESKPVKNRSMVPDHSKSNNDPGEQRGGFYDHYKQKRDEKLRGETAGKRAEKEVHLRAMQQFLDERKSEMASTKVSDVGRRPTPSKPQKSLKNLPQLAKPKKEVSKPAVVKKASSKASPVPAARKSWPSTPSPRATGISPARAPAGTTSAGTTPTRRKPQPASPVPRSSPKVERSQTRPKTVNVVPKDINKGNKVVNDKKQQTVTKSGKLAKTKTQTTTEDSPMAKPSFYSKVTKKSSVVPVESKPFLRKGSGTGPGVGPVVVKTKAALQAEDLGNSEDVVNVEETEVVTNTSDLVGKKQESDPDTLEIRADLISSPQVINPQKCEDPEISRQVTASADGSFTRMADSPTESAVEELIIHPTAWVEIEEHHDQSIPCDDRTCQTSSPANSAPVGMPSPRIRHSLSQMLLEEISESDITEWGNAENPPAMVYQKDSPKGLKRLLKFARKSRTDTHLTGWSSPSAFSEGEDDVEETKAGKRGADNLLRKARNYGPQMTTILEANEKNPSTHDDFGMLSLCSQVDFHPSPFISIS